MITKTSSRYSSISIFLHWVMVLLFIGVYASIELKGNFPKDDPMRGNLSTLHFILGLCILFLVIFRLVVRFCTKVPAIEPPLKSYETGLAHLMHLLLYVLMIATPLMGWIMLSAWGKESIPFIGFDLPPIVSPDKAFGKSVKEIHELFGNIGYFLIAGHAVVALVHHYVKKDTTLVRMLPFIKNKV